MAIVGALSTAGRPLNASAITKQSSKILGKKISWNTIQKYLNELVQVNKVQSVQLPHSKAENKNGLTLYSLKK
jgi:hypothetical protein